MRSAHAQIPSNTDEPLDGGADAISMLAGAGTASVATVTLSLAVSHIRDVAAPASVGRRGAKVLPDQIWRCDEFG
jgi:hypothetical protein